MTGAMIAAGIAVVVLLAVGVVLARQSGRQKKLAVESLEAEREAMAQPTILDLVNEEVGDLGLRDIEGADGLAPDALLRAWRAAPDSVRARDRNDVRFVADPAGEEVRLVAGAAHDAPDDRTDAQGPTSTGSPDDQPPTDPDPGEDHD